MIEFNCWASFVVGPNDGSMAVQHSMTIKRNGWRGRGEFTSLKSKPCPFAWWRRSVWSASLQSWSTQCVPGASCVLGNGAAFQTRFGSKNTWSNHYVTSAQVAFGQLPSYVQFFWSDADEVRTTSCGFRKVRWENMPGRGGAGRGGDSVTRTRTVMYIFPIYRPHVASATINVVPGTHLSS